MNSYGSGGNKQQMRDTMNTVQSPTYDILDKLYKVEITDDEELDKKQQ